MIYFYVGLGGVIGSILRFLISSIPVKAFEHFPLWTLLINLLGAFILGWFVARILPNKSIRAEIKTGFTSGVMGSFTTFSTLCNEVVQLFHDHYYLLLVLYMTLSVVGGLGFTLCGYKIGSRNPIEVNQS